MAAHQRNGAHAQAQTGVQPKHGGQPGAQNILQDHQHNGNHQEDDDLNAAFLQQLEAGHEANAGEEHGHEEGLQSAVKADGQHTGSVQGQVNQSVHQAAHNGRRNAVVVEGGDLFDDPAAQQQYQCRNSGCMVHVQIKFKHSILSSSLKISRTRKVLHLPFR